MRARNIKPGFFKNEEIGELSPFARILFCGLWCMADREGFVEYRPKLIKAELLPYDSEDVEKLLGDLRTCRVIDFLYWADGRDDCKPCLIHIINFLKHQNPHKQEKKSDFIELVHNREITGQTLNNIGSRPADSLILIPDSLIPDSLSPEERDIKPPAKRATNIPVDFQITTSMREWAKENASQETDIEIETQKFVNFWLGNGKKKVDWAATWRNWILNSKKYLKPDAGYQQYQKTPEGRPMGYGGTGKRLQ